MASQYFQDELAYLRESGNVFAERNPKLVKYLSERSTDPDVERLMEGFAFLTSRLREKLDDELPELSHSVIQLLWPNFMRPFPATALCRISPIEKSITAKQLVQRGTEMESNPVDGQICKFRTTSDVSVYPIIISDTQLIKSREKASLVINFEAFSGSKLKNIGVDDFRLWFTGDDFVAQMLYLWVRRYLKRVRISCPQSGLEYALPLDTIQPGGLRNEEAITGTVTGAFSGYSLIQEYFAFPDKFLCIDIVDLKKYFRDEDDEIFNIEFEFERPVPGEVKLRPNNIQLYCVPICNLFNHTADPLLIDQKRMEYPIRPSDWRKGTYHIFSIDKVASLHSPDKKEDEDDQLIYPAFESFDHETVSDVTFGQVYYRLKLTPSLVGEGHDYTMSFVHHDAAYTVPPEESISVNLTCHNGSLAHELSVGDITHLTETTEPFAKFENITRPISPILPPTDGRLFWDMISNLSLNYLSLLDRKALAAIISIYDFRAQSERRAERVSKKRIDGIVSVKSKPLDKLFKGLPCRGVKSTLEMRKSHFLNEGDMYLFCSILAEFFRLYSTINSFHELEVQELENGEVYRWPAKIGNQPLI